MTWYSNGYAEQCKRDKERMERERAERKERGEKRLPRFFLRKGEMSVWLCLDSAPFEGFPIREHHPRVNERWVDTFETCRKGLDGGCLFCEKGLESRFVDIFTGINLSPFKDRQTGEVVNVPVKKSLVCTPSSATLMAQKREQYESHLTLHMFAVRRTKDTAVKIGDNWDFIRVVDDVYAPITFRFAFAGEEMKEYTVQLKDSDGEPMDLSPFGLSPEASLEWYADMFEPRSRDSALRLFNDNDVTDNHARDMRLRQTANKPVRY